MDAQGGGLNDDLLRAVPLMKKNHLMFSVWEVEMLPEGNFSTIPQRIGHGPIAYYLRMLIWLLSRGFEKLKEGHA